MTGHVNTMIRKHDCVCDFNPETTDGPDIDCPVHGIEAYTERDTDLANRAVACKGWRWLPGMRLTDGRRGQAFATMHGQWEINSGSRWRPVGDLLPDLADPATLGCLLALVREAWGPTYMLAWRDGPDVKAFAITRTDGTTAFRITGGSLVGSLVLALGAAP